MATKKRGTTKNRPAAENLEAEEAQAQSEPETAVGPSETTEDKGADEIWWRCPHCSTKYPKREALMRANHLLRVHHIHE